MASSGNVESEQRQFDEHFKQPAHTVAIEESEVAQLDSEETLIAREYF